MSVNFEKHKSDLLAAWKDVVDDKTATDWVLVGYEGLGNDLKVVSKGDGGIEELKEELNSGTIMYAFVRVLDPKTSLHKFVLINWQGEGAPINRKGSCAGHLRDIANFFKGTHVTINARNEEEVDEDEIVDKLSKSTGSSYSFKARTEAVAPVKESVGTTYKKVIPKQEINSEERDKFWAAEEESERKRQAEEARVRNEKQKLAELERHRREANEAALREEKSKEVENNIKNESVPPEKIINQNIVKPRILEKENNTMSEKEVETKKSRNEEAKELISTRTVNARAIFENAASSNSSPTSIAKNPAPKANLRPSNFIFNSNKENGAQNPSLTTDYQNGSSVSPISKANESQSNLSVSETAAQVKSSEKPVEPAVELSLNHSSQSEMDQSNQDAISENDPSNDAHKPQSGETQETLRAIALYDYQAADETEISFDPGHIITHIDQIDVGWWQGLGPDGSYGLFPANYVELLDQDHP